VARLLTNRRLSGEGSAKNVRHFELGLGGSGLTYEVGDALGVWPSNDPGLAQELLAALGFDAEEAVSGRDRASVSLRLALESHYEITRIPPALLEYYAKATADEALSRLVSPTANGELEKFLWGREIIDLALAYPQVRFAPEDFVKLLRKLRPRLYSIASSLKAHPLEVHLCVGTLRYESLGRIRRGVASTFLAERVQKGGDVPIFVHNNPLFRLPAPEAPLIMIGPGTGIAPFRAFLEERRLTGAKGRNWLFFGDQHVGTDFLYGAEIEMWRREGLLTELDLAWSRDQANRVYVQHRMIEKGKELMAWLEAGACLRVCGDASRMARDVDSALRQIVQRAGGKSAEQAEEYVRKLTAEKRYVRDVY
jgi:sulfite reductase (NADPH) flavoprotein alpha-component